MTSAGKKAGAAAMALSAGLFNASSLLAAPIEVPIDPASTLTVEMCVQGRCDADTSGVAGSITVELDDTGAPTEITLHDFVFMLTDQIDLNISFGFLGGITTTGTDIVVSYATPTVALGPVPIVAGMYAFPNVDADAEGMFSYDATGVVCTLVSASGLPCADTINLAKQPSQTIDALDGTVEVIDGVLEMTVNVDFTSPINPDDPSLGDVTIRGTIAGSVELPKETCLGDFTGDGLVTTSDLTVLLANFGGVAGPDGGDLTGDGLVTTTDLTIFLGEFGSECS